MLSFSFVTVVSLVTDADGVSSDASLGSMSEQPVNDTAHNTKIKIILFSQISLLFYSSTLNYYCHFPPFSGKFLHLT